MEVVITEYNIYMGSVDQADFRCAVNSYSRKSTKLLHLIFFGLLDRTLSNAFIVFKKLENNSRTMLNYRRHVIQSLVTLSKPPKVGRPLGKSPLPVLLNTGTTRVTQSHPESTRANPR